MNNEELEVVSSRTFSLRKRAKKDDKKDHVNNTVIQTGSFERGTLTSLPLEIIFEILSYLSYQELVVMSRTNQFFEQLMQNWIPCRIYEVKDCEVDASEVIDTLKKLSLLRKIKIENRCDCDSILHQISLKNTKLQELHVTQCTGSTATLYLRSKHLVRLLKKCRSLHTIHILSSRFQGVQFYRLLGDMGLRLKAASTLATDLQYCTFIKHAVHIDEKQKESLFAMCSKNAKKGRTIWAPFFYLLIRPSIGTVYTALISYFYYPSMSIQLSPTNTSTAATTCNSNE